VPRAFEQHSTIIGTERDPQATLGGRHGDAGSGQGGKGAQSIEPATKRQEERFPAADNTPVGGEFRGKAAQGRCRRDARPQTEGQRSAQRRQRRQNSRLGEVRIQCAISIV
jgi:hypothetical protein